MPAAPCEPTIKLVAKRAGVRNRNEQRALGTNDPADLRQGARKILEMLQTVIRHHEVESTVGEGQPSSVGLNEHLSGSASRNSLVDSYHMGRRASRIKTAQRTP